MNKINYCDVVINVHKRDDLKKGLWVVGIGDPKASYPIVRITGTNLDKLLKKAIIMMRGRIGLGD